MLATIPLHSWFVHLLRPLSSTSLCQYRPSPPSPTQHPDNADVLLGACGLITGESDPLPSITALGRARGAADYFWDFIDHRLCNSKKHLTQVSLKKYRRHRAADFQESWGCGKVMGAEWASPLSKLYCWEMISPQCLAHSADSFLGLSRRRMARAWMCFWKASSLISSRDFSMVQRNASTRLSR